MSNNELETLRARVAELSAAVGRWEAMAKSVQDHRIEIQRERDAARASAARLREAGAEYLCARQAAERGEHFATGRAVDCEAVFSAALAATDSAEWLAKHDAALIAERDQWNGELLHLCRLSMEVFEHALQNAKWLTGGDERRMKDLVAALRSEVEGGDEGWLAKHDAEVRAPLEKERVRLLGLLDTDRVNLSMQNAGQEETIDILTAKVDSLTQQLAAATNDAARAELRARDLKGALEKTRDFAVRLIARATFSDNGQANSCIAADYGREVALMTRAALAASPDSDARLREVMELAAETGFISFGTNKYGDGEDRFKRIVDEVLRGGA